MTIERANDTLELARELSNFEEIASYLKPRPGDVPALTGFDIAAESLPLNGLVGGDHIIYIDFKRRYDLEARIHQAEAEGRSEVAENLRACRQMAGIVLADVSGHQKTDALLAAMLHQAFLLGSIYELDIFGQITIRLFENLNTRFHNSSGVHKFITLIYGEITEDARFRFISAGHPLPVVFSRLNDRFMEVSKEFCTTCHPLGALPSGNVIDRNATEHLLPFKDDFAVNEWKLMGKGDILLLFTDGLIEHGSEADPYFPFRFEEKVRELKDRSARAIVAGVKEELLELAPPRDDISLIAIKRL